MNFTVEGATGDPSGPEAKSVVIRESLLSVGAALIASGRSVYETEDEVRRLGAAYGAPGTRVSATPTGLLVSVGSNRSVGFEAAGPGLRFDQADAVARIVRDGLRGTLLPEAAIRKVQTAREAPSRVPQWLGYAALLPIAAGISLIVQPGWPNLLAALAGAVVSGGLMKLASKSALIQTLLPVLAAFAVSSLTFLAADHGLLEGPLRTLLAPLAVLLPGALLVTGMSELAAGAMVAGAARLTFGIVQLLLLALGIVAGAKLAFRGSTAGVGQFSDVQLHELGWWAPWLGLLLVGAGVYYNVSAPTGALPWIWLLLLVAFGGQMLGQAWSGAAAGGLIGAVFAAVGAAVIQRIPAGPPQIVVFLPAFWLLVPGSLGLLSTTALATDAESGFGAAISAVGVVTCIALGVLVGSGVGRALIRTFDRRWPRNTKTPSGC
ncbi:threonine/serine exporter family protein [Nakamurella antarctica]|uniref:Threonine/serine exporter family protein n=1 Tax=Nakamurella antarctica TaxID=1902245 RepID=A0A3G8ZNL3_9ACTN|nr:threonine/serine exporter family protein [Nakamurella antarctica]AZI58922.1 threonine/serine exporter family protein [Nakamurella antarctica]